LALISVDSAVLMSWKPKASPKDPKATVVPMKEVVYPIIHEPKDATIAERYTRQLYTAAGVGRSSIFARIPMLAVAKG
jgi:hypothetical protein